jgi:hypothetical protein
VSYISGEIRSGEQFETDKTPTALRPVIFSISLTPNPVIKSGSLFVQVFVRDVPMPIE